MWLFRKNPENLNEEQAVDLDKISKANLLTAKAYQMRLTLRDIYVKCTEPGGQVILYVC
jgi:hypothetical protein